VWFNRIQPDQELLLRAFFLGLQIQQIPDGILYRVELRGRQASQFSFETIVVNARQALDIHSGVFRKPLGFADIYLTTQTTNLGCEGRHYHQSTGILRLRISQYNYRSLFCSSSEINNPNLARIWFNTRQGYPPKPCPVQPW